MSKKQLVSVLGITLSSLLAWVIAIASIWLVFLMRADSFIEQIDHLNFINTSRKVSLLFLVFWGARLYESQILKKP